MIFASLPPESKEPPVITGPKFNDIYVAFDTLNRMDTEKMTEKTIEEFQETLQHLFKELRAMTQTRIIVPKGTEIK